jgi:hypothetical protein
MEPREIEGRLEIIYFSLFVMAEPQISSNIQALPVGILEKISKKKSRGSRQKNHHFSLKMLNENILSV